MPWIVLVCACVLGACSFEADYTDGTFYCRDNPACPPGLTCDETSGVCVAQPKDAGTDDVLADAPDAHVAELTCSDPGVLISSMEVAGTTDGRTNRTASVCSGGGGVQSAPDAVYRITTTAVNQQLHVSITGSLNAYVLNACMNAPNTVACMDGVVATETNPIDITAAAAGDYFVVVDALAVSTTGTYELTVTVQ